MGEGGRLAAARFGKLALATSVLLVNVVGMCAAELSPVRGGDSIRRDGGASVAFQVPFWESGGAALPDWIEDRTGGPSNDSIPVRIPGPRSLEHKDFIPATARRSSSCSQHAHCPLGQFCTSLDVCGDCSGCNYNQDSYDSTCPVDRCPGTPLQATTDVTPPRVHWLFVDPEDVSVEVPEGGSSSQVVKTWVDIYFYTSDEGSGLQRAEFVFLSSSMLSGIRCRSHASLDLKQGNVNAGMFHNRFWFQTNDEGGLWRLWQIWLVDSDDNYRLYNAQDIFLFGQRGDVNGTFRVTAEDYERCSDAEEARERQTSIDTCGNHNAQCVDRLWGGEDVYATCSCNPGYYGDTWTCMENSKNYTNTDFQGQVYRTNEAHSPSEASGGDGEAGGGLDRTPGTQGGGSGPGQGSNGATSPPPSSGPILPAAAMNGWTGTDTRIASSAIGAALIFVLCFQCRRNLRQIRQNLGRENRRRNQRVHPSEVLDYELAQHIGLGPAVQRSIAEQRRRLDEMEWVHELRERRRQMERTRGRVGMSTDRDMQQYEIMQLQQIVEAEEEIRRLRMSDGASGRLGRQIRAFTGRDAEREAQLRSSNMELSRFILASSLRLSSASAENLQPTPPPVASLPDHLLLPGRAVEANLAVEQECVVCMEQRNGAELRPCGHKDMCFGCANHIFKSGGHCPMCRAVIASVKE